MEKRPLVVTPEALLLYPALFEPKAMQQGQDPKFSCLLVFPAGADLSALKAEAASAAQATFGARVPANLRSPFRKGEEKPEWGEFMAGATFMRVASKFKPHIVDGNRLPVGEDNKELFYSGAIVRAAVHFYGYSHSGNVGVSCGLDGIQFVKDGERIQGTNVAALFDIVPGAPAEKSPADLFGDV